MVVNNTQNTNVRKANKSGKKTLLKKKKENMGNKQKKIKSTYRMRNTTKTLSK